MPAGQRQGLYYTLVLPARLRHCVPVVVVRVQFEPTRGPARRWRGYGAAGLRGPVRREQGSAAAGATGATGAAEFESGRHAVVHRRSLRSYGSGRASSPMTHTSNSDALLFCTQAIHTCSSTTARHRSVATVDDCKALCDATAGCEFILWSYNFGGYCYTAAHCATSGSNMNCNLAQFHATPGSDRPPPPPPPSPPLAASASGIVALRDPRSMNLGDRPHLFTALDGMSPPQIYTDVDFISGQVASLIEGFSTVLIYNQDNCYMDLSSADNAALASFVSGGGLLVVMGDWAQRADTSRVPAGSSCDITDARNAMGKLADPRADSASYLLSQTFGWTDVQQASDGISPGVYGTPHPFRKTAAAAGTVFASGPAQLSGEVTYELQHKWPLCWVHFMLKCGHKCVLHPR